MVEEFALEGLSVQLLGTPETYPALTGVVQSYHAYVGLVLGVGVAVSCCPAEALPPTDTVSFVAVTDVASV